MKRTISFLVFVMLLLTALTACSGGENLLEEKLDLENVVSIKIAANTDTHQEIELDKTRWQELKDQLLAYSPKWREKNDDKGWEYLICFTYSDGTYFNVSFLDEKMHFNGKAYKITDYTSDDLLCFFDE